MVLESGSWSYPLDSGLERGDVAAHLGKPEATESGFHGRLLLPAAMGSDELLQIVAYRESGDRVVLKNIRYASESSFPLCGSSWLDQYPSWREDPFWFALGTSGISAGVSFRVSRRRTESTIAAPFVLVCECPFSICAPPAAGRRTG